MEREQHAELGEIGLHRRGHVGILQLAGDALAVERDRAVDLAERGRGGRRKIEGRELRLPVRAKFGLHAPAHEGGAHRRGVRLQLHQLFGIVGRQCFGDGRKQLRDLHHRALHGAERLGESARIVLTGAAG